MLILVRKAVLRRGGQTTCLMPSFLDVLIELLGKNSITRLFWETKLIQRWHNLVKDISRRSSKCHWRRPIGTEWISYFLRFKKLGTLYQNPRWLGHTGVSCEWRRGGICRKRTSPIKRSYFFETEEVIYKLCYNLYPILTNLAQISLCSFPS